LAWDTPFPGAIASHVPGVARVAASSAQCAEDRPSRPGLVEQALLDRLCSNHTQSRR